MPEDKASSRFSFLRTKSVMAVTGVLALQIILFYSIPTKENIPHPPPLDTFTTHVGDWKMLDQIPPDDYANSLLRADDTLQRDYTGPSHVELFVAFFKSQRAGVTPHSPKMCLPASGWTQESSSTDQVRVPGEPAPIPVNRYVVSREGEHKLVLYWFQGPHRVTANEYLSRLFLISDSIRYRRSDEALVRVVTELGGKADAQQEDHAIQFIQALYQPLKQQIWTGPTNAVVLP
jgi:EpsI family protein